MKNEARYYVYQLRVEGAAEPFYIGKGTGKRAWKHLQPCNLVERKDRNLLKIRTIVAAQDAGKGLVAEILVEKLTEDEALEMEVTLIAKYGRINIRTGILTNLTDGGDGTSKLSEESSARKIAAFRAAWEKRTAQEKDVWIAKQQATKTALYSDPVRSAEARARHSRASKGRPKNPMSVEKMRQSKREFFGNKEASAEWRKRKSDEVKKHRANGGLNYFKGKKLRPEMIEKMKATKAAISADPIRSEEIRQKRLATLQAKATNQAQTSGQIELIFV